MTAPAVAARPGRLVDAVRVELRPPTIGLWAPTYGSWRGQRIPDAYFVSGVAMGCAVAVLFPIFGARLGAWFVQRRRDKLASFLADPDLG